MSTPERDDDAVPAVPDVELAWADIVARWEGEVPDADDVVAEHDGSDDAVTSGATGPPAADDLGPPTRPGAPAARVPAGPRDHAVAEPDEDDAYVPAEPPPLSRVGWSTWLPWAGVLGGPLLLVLAAVFYRSVPAMLLAFAVTAFTAGAVLLVLRLPTRREDDGDDGAVV